MFGGAVYLIIHLNVCSTGTTKIENLENNIGSLDLKLSQEDLRTISESVPIDEVAGERESDVFSKYCWEFAITPPKTG